MILLYYTIPHIPVADHALNTGTLIFLIAAVLSLVFVGVVAPHGVLICFKRPPSR